MRVLVACEESQRVCQAFRDKGHEAYSCDILEPSGGHPEWHILGDAVPLVNGNCTFRTMDGATHTIDGKWDLLIAHPPCTYLSNVATRQYSLKCCTAEKVIARWEERARAAVFFMRFALADCDRIAVENPVGFMNSSYRKPDQIIHPYFFAESEDDAENYYEKRTCLWLKGLPQLERSSCLPPPPPMYILQGEKGKGKKIGWCEGMRNIKGGQAERAKARSKTFPGIAKAMAEQWGTIEADRKTEPTHDLRTETHECVKDTHDKTESTICDFCRYYNSNIPCGSTPSACKEADKFAEEFVNGLKDLRIIEADRKTEPTGYNLSPVEGEQTETKKETQNSNLTFEKTDEPQTDVYDYKGNGKWERSE